METNKLQWKRINMGDILPCQSFLRKKDGEILKLSTVGGVKVGQDCYYLPVDEVINVIKDYPVEESKDEEIRKDIVFYIAANHKDDGEKARWLYWLEKQGEHANFRNKIQIGDKVTRNENGVLVNLSQLNRVAKKDEKQGEQKLDGTFVNIDDVREDFVNEVYRVLDADPNNDRANQIIDAFDNLPIVAIEKQGEQKVIIPKFRVGDVIRYDEDGETNRVIEIIEEGYKLEHGTHILCFQSQDNWELVEQKPADKVEPKFKVGDWIVRELDNTCYQIKKCILNVTNNKYGYDLTSGGYISSQDANFYHLWTIQDAKDGDVLAAEDKIFLYNGNLDLRGRVCAYCGIYKTHDGLRFTECAIGNYFTYKEPCPATKEQRDLLFQKMKEAGYEWDAEKKELKKIEQKSADLPNGEDYGIDGLYAAVDILQKTLGKVEGYQTDDGILEHECAISAVKKLSKQKHAEWSGEDEEYLKAAIWYAENPAHKVVKNSMLVEWLKSLKDRIGCEAKCTTTKEWNKEDEDCINSILAVINGTSSLTPSEKESHKEWLKSLRPQNTWKPSKELLNGLKEAIEFLSWYNPRRKQLQSLYEQLKKLSEE